MTIVEAARAQTSSRSLSQGLEALVADDADRWSFRRASPTDVGACLYQYPAMMVPRLQREILDVCVGWNEQITTVYDPFLGSGTVLTESMLQGLAFVGGDINPLAILISRVRAEAMDPDLALAAADAALTRAAAGRARKPHLFPGRDKWFTPAVAKGLDRLRLAIEQTPSARTRRFLWVALAETVRLVSNSRTSTVKLHIRPIDEIADRPQPADVFATIARRNAEILRRFRAELVRRGLMYRGRYIGQVDLRITDVRARRQVCADIVVTSPPYGDGHSTVPYGQASYLPLQWVDGADIGPFADELLSSTRQIDFRSLGGSLAAWSQTAEHMAARSGFLASAFEALLDEPDDRTARIAAFYSDLDAALQLTLQRINPGGLLVLTVGDRTVGGVQVPMADVIYDLADGKAEPIAKLARTIPLNRKRQAGRNSIAATMGSETVLVLQRSNVST
jgi:site-specific DNA-methyltransferase (cytosine-N4-specific)